MIKPVPVVVAKRLARQGAMQAIYQWQIANMPVKEVMTMYKQIKPLDDKTDKIYFQQLLQGVLKNHEKLDALFNPYIVNDKYHLGEVEKAIFRIATYELCFLSQEIDAAVVISEAVVMAKSYTADKSYTFVNGVLDNLRKNLKPID